MPEVIVARAVHKAFGTTKALRGLDLSVDKGSIHGFLGPNGAGKSTTLRLLLGLIRADDGQLTLLGGDPWADAVSLHRQVAYLPSDVALWPNLTGGEVLDVLASLRGSEDAALRATLIERFDFDPSKKIRAYSTGNRQKVMLVAALSSGAEVLILDEPATGLDPLMEATFRGVVTDLKKQGTTVLLSSHLLAEVEHLADTVTIVRDGVTVMDGSLATLRELNPQASSLEDLFLSQYASDSTASAPGTHPDRGPSDS